MPRKPKGKKKGVVELLDEDIQRILESSVDDLSDPKASPAEKVKSRKNIDEALRCRECGGETLYDTQRADLLCASCGFVEREKEVITQPYKVHAEIIDKHGQAVISGGPETPYLSAATFMNHSDISKLRSKVSDRVKQETRGKNLTDSEVEKIEEEEVVKEAVNEEREKGDLTKKDVENIKKNTKRVLQDARLMFRRLSKIDATITGKSASKRGRTHFTRLLLSIDLAKQKLNLSKSVTDQVWQLTYNMLNAGMAKGRTVNDVVAAAILMTTSRMKLPKSPERAIAAASSGDYQATVRHTNAVISDTYKLANDVEEGNHWRKFKRIGISSLWILPEIKSWIRQIGAELGLEPYIENAAGWIVETADKKDTVRFRSSGTPRIIAAGAIAHAMENYERPVELRELAMATSSRGDTISKAKERLEPIGVNYALEETKTSKIRDRTIADIMLDEIGIEFKKVEEKPTMSLIEKTKIRQEYDRQRSIAASELVDCLTEKTSKRGLNILKFERRTYEGVMVRTPVGLALDSDEARQIAGECHKTVQFNVITRARETGEKKDGFTTPSPRRPRLLPHRS